MSDRRNGGSEESGSEEAGGRHPQPGSEGDQGPAGDRGQPAREYQSQDPLSPGPCFTSVYNVAEPESVWCWLRTESRKGAVCDRRGCCDVVSAHHLYWREMLLTDSNRTSSVGFLCISDITVSLTAASVVSVLCRHDGNRPGDGALQVQLWELDSCWILVWGQRLTLHSFFLIRLWSWRTSSLTARASSWCLTSCCPTCLRSSGTLTHNLWPRLRSKVTWWCCWRASPSCITTTSCTGWEVSV